MEVDDSGFIIQAKLWYDSKFNHYYSNCLLLSDFGLATEVSNDKENQLAVGTARWYVSGIQIRTTLLI